MITETICVILAILVQIAALVVAARFIRTRANLSMWALAAPPLVALLLLELDWILTLRSAGVRVIPSELSRGLVVFIASALLLSGTLLIRHLIGDLKKRENDVREDAENFRRLLESAPDAMLIVNPQREIVLVNAETVRMFGYSREELMGKQVINLLMPEGFPTVHFTKEAVAGAASGPMRMTVELLAVRKNGEKFPVELTLNPLATEGTVLVSACMRDITERHRMMEKNREQAALLDEANDAIILHDLEGRVLLWNQGAVRIYGWSVGEAAGRLLADFLFKDAAPLAAAHATTLEKGEWLGELKQITKDGREVVVQSHWTLVRDDQGKPKSILSINTDITKMKLMEAQYLRAQRLESVGTLANGVAHDLNNILTPILICAEILKMKHGDKDEDGALSTIHTNAQRGARLIRQILTFSRGTAAEFSEFQVRHLIKETKSLLKQTFPANIETQTNVPNDLWTVRGNATQLDQVLMNLCVNARDAMPDGGRLRIEATNVQLPGADQTGPLGAAPGPYVLLTVSDTGMGIPAESRERIFDPFFTTKELGKGTGLGLATVISLVKAHGGFIDFESEVGKGTRFKIHLPAVTEPGASEPKAEGPVVRRGQGECILVVDDEASMREAVKNSLEIHGYRAVVAKDGIEALTVFMQNRDRVRVVVTDLMMPNLSGPALIRVLNTLEPRLPIIAITGSVESDYENMVKECDIKVIVPKPFSAAELTLQIAKLVDES